MDFTELFQQAGFVFSVLVVAYMLLRLIINAQTKTNSDESINQRELIKLSNRALDTMDKTVEVIKDLREFIKHVDERRTIQNDAILSAIREQNLKIDDVWTITTDTNARIRVLVNDERSSPQPSLLIEDD